MSSAQKVSWFKFILLWFVISKWNFLQSALDWLTLSWTFCFYFEADNNVCWHVFCFNCVGTPWSYLYESSNHNTKSMSAKEILSEKGKIPLMCLSVQRFLQPWKLCPLVRNGVPYTFSPRPAPCFRRPPIAPKQSCSLSGKVCHLVLAHSFAGRCVYIIGSQTESWNVTRVKYKVDSIFLKLGDASDL